MTKPRGTFLKSGVGVLRRGDARPYTFGGAYPIVDGGKWAVKTRKNSVTFRQVLRSTFGYAYVYEKTLKLDGRAHTLTLTHTYQATGYRGVQP